MNANVSATVNATATAKRRLFAVAAPGLENLVATEVAALGQSGCERSVPGVDVGPGGVEFDGDLALLYRANLALRYASRVLLRCGEVTAREFAALRRGLATLDLGPFLPRQGELALVVHASAERCRLYHTGALAECVADALSTRGRTVRLQRPSESDSETPGGAPDPGRVEVWLRGVGDRFTLSLDTSGALLHQRGYRSESGPAPLRETLAAALVRLAGFAGTGALCDPMCGSGTLVIEAALQAQNRAVGLGRSFAFQTWPSYEPDRFAAVVAQLRQGELALDAVRAQSRFLASDRDAAVLALARRNAERAGVAELIEFAPADVGSLRLPPAPTGGGLILTNPPYGRRLGDGDLGGLYRKLARLPRSAPGWRLALVTSQPALARLALRHPIAIPLRNGGLAVALYLDRRYPVAERGSVATTPSDGPTV